jgi:short-subunit dehydrogenase
MRKAIVIGATSGIGEALVKSLLQRGYQVAATGRRTDRLLALQSAYPSLLISQMDVVNVEESLVQMASLTQQLDGLDVLILNAGVGYPFPKPHQVDQTINVNVRAFVHLANWGYQYFKNQGIKGRIVGISSVAAHRGTASADVYSATKAFVSNFMQGLRQRSVIEQLGISIIDIRPGFVDTEMTSGQRGMFWVASASKAAEQICDAIERRAKVAYITRRWRYVAMLMSAIPDFILDSFMKKSVVNK